MKILYMSDLHLERSEDNGAAFISGLTEPADVLVLAGDICARPQLNSVMAHFCRRFSRVVYVTGNHEFYGSNRKAVLDEVALVDQDNSIAIADGEGVGSFFWLDCDVATIGGVRFVGTPLWFRQHPTAPKHAMNDFDAIENFESWVYEENARALSFLERTVQRGDVVVTHYLPSPRSIHPKYKNDPTNPFFLCDVERIIKNREPAAWIHGHTHGSADYRIGPTRVVCNPRGYHDHNENARDFSTSKVIEL